MNYGEIKRAVLELINQQSIAGVPIASDYNNQSDYISRIPGRINEAVMYIRTGVYPKRHVMPVEQTNTTGWEAVYLPSDCRRIISGGIREVTASGPVPTTKYRLLGDNQIWFPAGSSAAPVDAYTLQEDPDVLQAAIYYTAAHLVRMDDEFSYQALYNEYNARLATLAPAVTAEIVPIQDVYQTGYEY